MPGIKHLLIVLILLQEVNGYCEERKATDDTLQKVGMIMRDFADSSRLNWLGTGPRPVRTTIWYPSSGGPQKELINDSNQLVTPQEIFPSGPFSETSQNYPLIILSHGASGNAAQMIWFGYYLASRGYIVAAINHIGTPAEERNFTIPTMSDFFMWERPRDIITVLNKLLADPVLSTKIDQQRIGAAGYSLGGSTAIWIGGGRLNLKKLVSKSPVPSQFKTSVDKLFEIYKTDTLLTESKRHAQDLYYDNRIKCIFALAPAIGQGFTKKGLRKLKVPVRIVVGSEDRITPSETNAELFAQRIKGADLTILPGEAGHFSTQESLEQAKRLEEVSWLAYSFFEKVLARQDDMKVMNIQR